MKITVEKLFSALTSNSDFLSGKGYEIVRQEKKIKFIKHELERIYLIELETRDYSDLTVSGFSTNIIFNEIERPIAKATSKELEQTIYQLANPSEDFNIRFKKTANNIHFTISDSADLQNFLSYFKSFYFDEVLPFQKDYDSICKISDWLQDNDYMTHSKLLYNGDGTFMFRKLLILNISNASGFKKLYEQYNGFLKIKSETNETPFKELYGAFRKLDDCLTKTYEA